MISSSPLDGHEFAWAAVRRNGLFVAAYRLFTPAVLALTLIGALGLPALITRMLEAGRRPQ